MRVGVDIGGTFTDFVAAEGDKLTVYKALSTPHNPAEALLKGLQHLTRGALTHVAHGSTVATNAILERKGARVAFITNAGLRDLLFIGRQHRPQLYALAPKLPPPLVPRNDCYTVDGRLDHTGAELQPLTTAALDALLAALRPHAYEAYAVCLLHSFRNPAHEHAVRDALISGLGVPAWRVALSSDVLPEFREYERASTTVLEASVRPKMAAYVQNIAANLPPHCGLHLMRSDGGLMTATQVQTHAVHTALSGPAAGVLGAWHVASLAGETRLITLDIGGTSTDVALCDGNIPTAQRGDIDGLPLGVRMLDIETVGAGGGSIARLDEGGALRVGPHSAGASPGPVAYGRGGTQPTVTDAHVLLGRLDATRFLGGRMALDTDGALQAFSPLAKPFGGDIVAAARGVVTVANTHIHRAIHRVSIERGHDPRAFTLCAFGGAGGLHACEVADGLGITRVLIPRHTGVLCALGLLMADVRVAFVRPLLELATRHSVPAARALQAELLARAHDVLTNEGIATEHRHLMFTLDMRYQGQAHELNVPFKGDVVARFHEAHERAYGYALEGRSVELVALRLTATGNRQKPTLEAFALGDEDASPALLHTLTLPDGQQAACYSRDRLKAGMRFAGCALVFQMDSTLYVPHGWQAQVDAWHNMLLTRA